MSLEDRAIGFVFLPQCQRCGEEHESPLLTLTNPTDKFAFWTMCPNTDEPALIQIKPEDLGDGEGS
jgi:hypothetical protein